MSAWLPLAILLASLTLFVIFAFVLGAIVNKLTSLVKSLQEKETNSNIESEDTEAVSNP